MDIIAGVIVAVLFIVLSFIYKRIKIRKRFSTAFMSGFIAFIIFTGKVASLGQKISIIVVTLLLIYAVNLKIGDENGELRTPGEE